MKRRWKQVAAKARRKFFRDSRREARLPHLSGNERGKCDYERTLKRIEALMEAKFGTKAGDELDVLTTLVEAYEAKHYAISRPDPVEASSFGWINSA